MKRIIIIAHFCDYGNESTNNRFNYIATMLHKMGVEIELITSSFSHREKKQRKKVKDNIYKTTLIYEPSYSRNVSLKRLLYCHKKMAKNLEEYLKSCSKPDIVYCAVPSLSVAKTAADYCSHKKVRFIIDIQDLWPEAFEMVLNIPYINKIVFSPFTILANRIYRQADEIIAVSQTYVDRALAVNKKCKKGYPIFLGTDLEIFDRNTRENHIKKENDRLRVVYCGTLGNSYDLKSVIKALSILKEKKPIFIVIGDGPLKDCFVQYAKKKGIESVFTGWLPYKRMCGFLVSCDIAVNPIVPGAAQSIINKHADYAMAGLPVINTQENGEYRELVETYQMGINCKCSNHLELASALDKMISDTDFRHKCAINARKCGEEKFDRRISYKTIANIINQ